jgi:pyrroline-5-carboxylate reductase
MKDKLSNKKNAHYSKPAPKNQKKFGVGVYIIGAGVMGSAIAKVLAKKGQKVFVYDRTYVKAKALAKGKKILADKNFENLGKADMIIVAVKPQDVPALAEEVKGRLKASAIVVSIAAGLQLKKLVKLFRHARLVRVMPSLALTVGEGVAFWKSAAVLSADDKRRVKRLLNCFTEHFEAADENLIDAGSIIYGSGPAYFFYLADVLRTAAVSLGLEPDMAGKLVEKTFLAAALLQRTRDYRDLINQIASKGGTTEAALKIFEKRHLDGIVKEAVQAACKRVGELSK